MTNALLANPEQEQNEALFDTSEYVKEKLAKQEAFDKDGLERPVYTINGREVAFRTIQQSPTFDNETVFVPGGNSVYPLELEVYNDATQSTEISDQSKVRNYVDTHQDPSANRLMVTNTPEGMLSAAAILVESKEESGRLLKLAESFTSRKEWGDEQKEALDTMLAAVSVDDKGELTENLNLDGWAVALAALSGDEAAKSAITKKRQALIDAERERASQPEKSEAGSQEVEPLPLDEIALVHSTKYDVERDENGAVVLRPAGQLRDDKLPRSSIHFTLNSTVGDVIGGGDQHEWADDNKIIVANFKNTIDTAKKLPTNMAGMDTWFTLNPGEQLRLPGALVVESVDQLPDGKIIEEDEYGIRYVYKDQYSQDEQFTLNDYRRRLGSTGSYLGVQDLAVRLAMQRVGVSPDMMDQASSDGHGMHSSRAIEGRIRATAKALGLPAGKHFETPESNLEMNARYNLAEGLSKVDQADPSYLESYRMESHYRAPLEARRLVLANGYYPANPNTPTDEAVDFYEQQSSNDWGF